MLDPAPAPAGLTEALRPGIAGLPASKIREVADCIAGLGHTGIMRQLMSYCKLFH